MKIKVKWDGERKLVEIEDRSISDVTLDELKQHVSTLFNAQELEFGLSLNRREALEGGTQALSEFGLVSGDLLYVVGPSLPAAAGAANSEASQSSSSTENNSASSDVVASMSVDALPHNTEPEASMKNDDIAGPPQSADRMDDTDADNRELFYSAVSSAQVNRSLAEPLVIRESTGSAVPVLLSQLFNNAGVTSGLDAVWVAVHCLLLEAGFCTDEACESNTVMPGEWRRSGYYRSEFSYSVAPGKVACCSVTGVTLGSTLAVHGVTVKKDENDASFTTDIIHLQSCQYIRGETITDAVNTYRGLDRLSLLVKDKICLPLINEMATSAGYREEQGLLAMPKEVLLRICSCLDAQSLCHLGATCAELADMYRDRVLWRRLYLLFFPGPQNLSLSQDWFQMYREQTLIFKRRQAEFKQQRALWNRPDGMWMPPMHPFAPPPPVGPMFPPRHPFILGGEHDLYPAMPPGPHRDPRDPRNMFLNRNSNQVIGPGLPGVFGNQGSLERNSMPGPFGSLGIPGRRRGDNLTGSPFLNQGGFL